MSSGKFSRVLVAAVGTVAAALIVAMGVAIARDVGGTDVGATDSSLSSGIDFDLPRFDGSRFILSEHATAPVFIYFWASWCGPCEDEAPVIQKLWPEYEALGYTFVGVNIWDGEDAAREFVNRHGLTFPVVIDGDGTAYLDYGVISIPEAFFLKPGLVVDRKYIGVLTEAPLRERLAAIGES
ncbi:MAG: TlpA disulfide reductase family protein [Chloroflexi bacterium]|nr:TlpA disulfide reductase family protein [Chloroflexota bacterium]MDA1147313.1 TlpA disulfide reductase family protein [Chloroflexota bacterium]